MLTAPRPSFQNFDILRVIDYREPEFRRLTVIQVSSPSRAAQTLPHRRNRDAAAERDTQLERHIGQDIEDSPR